MSGWGAAVMIDSRLVFLARRRPVFVLQLRPEPRVDPVRASRQALKRLLRDHGLRCVSATGSSSK
jgi:hypothetical protein